MFSYILFRHWQIHLIGVGFDPRSLPELQHGNRASRGVRNRASTTDPAFNAASDDDHIPRKSPQR